jgi:plastocyanin
MNSRPRPIRRWFLFGSLVAFAFALCVIGARTQSGTTVTVTITPGTSPSVSPDPATISKKAGDQVEWVCSGGCTFKVHFPKGTPFSTGTFDNAHAKSGAVTGKAKTGLYHYAVTVDGHTIDPGVQVNP